MKKQYTFTAVILRDGEKRFVADAMTYGEEKYLCSANGRPYFNADFFQDGGLSKEGAREFRHVKDVIGTEYEKALLRYGKHDQYWIWNHEAAERKKVAKSKTVRFWAKKEDPYDDEPEYYLSGDRFKYPIEIWNAIFPWLEKEQWRNQTKYRVKSFRAIETALSELGWKVECK